MSIVLDSLRRLQLSNARDRIDASWDALDIAAGVWTPNDGEITPTTTNETRREAWTRLKRQQQTLGPRIMETKLAAILGDVVWETGTDEDLDDDLTSLDVRRLARLLLEPYIVVGITAGMAHDTGDNRGVTITPLGGAIEPITHPEDVSTVIGLFQAWHESKDTHRTRLTPTAFDDTAARNRSTSAPGSWFVRVYDWSESEDDLCTVRMWRDLRDPTTLGTTFDEIINAPRPRYRVRRWTFDGLPLGEVERAMPQLKALWATEARQTLSEEYAAYPMLKALGDIDTTNLRIGPAEPITGEAGATVEWLTPGNLGELRAQQQQRSMRIQQDLSLPGGFLGNDSPSGEAFKEANIKFSQNSEGYARDVGGLLTELVRDYARLVGAEPASVGVTTSKDHQETDRVGNVIALFKEGLLPLDVAAKAIQTFFPTWSDEALAEWVDSQSRVVTAEDFVAAAQGAQ